MAKETVGVGVTVGHGVVVRVRVCVIVDVCVIVGLAVLVGVTVVVWVATTVPDGIAVELAEARGLGVGSPYAAELKSRNRNLFMVPLI